MPLALEKASSELSTSIMVVFLSYKVNLIIKFTRLFKAILLCLYIYLWLMVFSSVYIMDPLTMF